MKQERKTLVMVSLENRDCDYEIVKGGPYGPPFMFSPFLQSGPGCWWRGSLPAVPAVPVVADSSRRHHGRLGAVGRGRGVVVLLSPWRGVRGADHLGAKV